MTTGEVMETVVQTALIEKIQRLERWVDELQGELRQAREAALGPNLGTLRLRECVLLYVGTDDMNTFATKLEDSLGPVARDALAHLFDINNAPLPEGQREALRAAFNHGMDRW